MGTLQKTYYLFVFRADDLPYDINAWTEKDNGTYVLETIITNGIYHNQESNHYKIMFNPTPHKMYPHNLSDNLSDKSRVV